MRPTYIEFNGLRFYLDKSGYYSARLRLHRAIWEQAHGPIPSGYHVHHRNGNKSDNSIDNLVLLSHGEHSAEHVERLGHHRDRARANSIATQNRQRAERSKRELVCAVCKSIYHSGAITPSRFCSPDCVERARSAAFTGEQRVCEFCATPYAATRRTQRYCSRRCNNRACEARLPSAGERLLACPECGTQFRSKRSNARFCSRDCATLFHGRHLLRGKIADYSARL